MTFKAIDSKIIQEIEQAFQHVGDYGSVEIYVQGSQITQVTSRRIQKTSYLLQHKKRHQRLPALAIK